MLRNVMLGAAMINTVHAPPVVLDGAGVAMVARRVDGMDANVMLDVDSRYATAGNVCVTDAAGAASMRVTFVHE